VKESLIHAEWLYDSTDCDQAGCSGGWSEGARVTINGDFWFELTPQASCFGGPSWGKEEVFAEILKRLGHRFTSEYG
jgi:hypothetical protein